MLERCALQCLTALGGQLKVDGGVVEERHGCAFLVGCAWLDVEGLTARASTREHQTERSGGVTR
jgi:hypothetical protein